MRNILASILILISISIRTEARVKKPKVLHNLTGAVQSCHDGDTCRVLTPEGKILKVRFAGIDTPELSQLYGAQAKRYTESQVLGKNVSLECDGESYDRVTCTVFQRGKNVNEEVVRAGWAYDSKKYSKGRYAEVANRAKEKKLGIWASFDPKSSLSPYCYRHKKAKKCQSDHSFMP